MPNLCPRQEFLVTNPPTSTALMADFSDGFRRRFAGFDIHVGRLQEIDERHWTVGWQGESNSFFIEESPLHLGVFTDEFAVFRPLRPVRDVVRIGDIVALKIEREKITAAQMLVPCEGAGPAPFDHSLLAQWTAYLNCLRRFFLDRGFIEASTPSLVTSPGMEPHLHAFSTVLTEGRQRKEFFLPTSPEFHLKKMLCRGAGKVFEVKRCFRNEESGPHHQPEFLMLEWYRAFAPLRSVAEDTRRLLNALQGAILPQNPPLSFRQTTMAELFRENCRFDLRPDTSTEELKRCCLQWQIHTDRHDSWNDLFHRLYLEKVEPSLAHQEVVFVFDFPPQQMDLARLNERGWSERFEVYWRGVELANAFDELNDWREQVRRAEAANRLKKQLGLQPFPVDQEFIDHLKFGLPPSSGIALGVERLFMMLLGKSRLNEVVVFAHDSEASS